MTRRAVVDAKRVVVKVGSSSLTTAAGGLDPQRLAALADVIADVRRRGAEVVLVLTGAGEIVTRRPGDDLFDAFPNSYGSLGYATRLRIELERISPYVEMRHVRVEDHLLPRVIEDIVATGQLDGVRVDGRRWPVGGHEHFR